jgi:Uncharacterised nucleotidyltransferase
VRLRGAAIPIAGASAIAIRTLTAFPQQLPKALAEEAVAEFEDDLALAEAVIPRGLAHVVRTCCGRAAIFQDDSNALAMHKVFSDAIIEQYLCELPRVIADLHNKGIQAMIPKGLFFAGSVYPQLDAPFFNDVDLLVRDADVALASAVLADHEYRSDLVVMDNTPVMLPESVLKARNSELGNFATIGNFSKLVRAEALDPYHKFARRFLRWQVAIVNRKAYLCQTFDLHRSLNSVHDEAGSRFRPREQDWWSATQKVSLRDVDFAAPTDTTIAWFAANHLYTDVMLFGDRNLKLLGDLIAFVKAGRVDYDILAGVASDHIALAPSLYYIFRMLRSSFGVEVPSDFIDALNLPVHSSGTDFADFGDPLAKILGLRFEVAVEDV